MTNSELIAWNWGRYLRSLSLYADDPAPWPPDPSQYPLGATQTTARARLGPDGWFRWVSRGMTDPAPPREAQG